jgi:protein EFR3
MSIPSCLPPVTNLGVGSFHTRREAKHFSSDCDMTMDRWQGLDPESALMAIVSSANVQRATGLDRQGLLQRFTVKWTVESSLKDCEFFIPCLTW